MVSIKRIVLNIRIINRGFISFMVSVRNFQVTNIIRISFVLISINRNLIYIILDDKSSLMGHYNVLYLAQLI